MIPKTIIAGIEDKIIIVFNEIYKKIKASQGNIFTAPMASGGGLTDLILQCLVFGAVPLRKVSPWILMALRIRKKGLGSRRFPYRL